MSQKSTLNVIVFGETGAGKSSIVNMILGSDKANVGGGARGETFKTTAYPVELNGNSYNLHDTVGFGEHSEGTADSIKAARNLYRLLIDLSNSGGVNLLVFVVRTGRLSENRVKNYRLFYEGFCQSKVPIVIVVTGCETVEPPMNLWWTENKQWFTRAGMLFKGHACVCAFKGTEAGGYQNANLVKESVEAVKQLVIQHCTSAGWTEPPVFWLQEVLGSLIGLFRSSKVPVVYTDLHDRLKAIAGAEDAEKIIIAIAENFIPNVIVFGATGAGKTSVVNMILGSDEASAEGGLTRRLQNDVYTGDILGKGYKLYDTIGLGEESRDAESASATKNLFDLVGELSKSGGINLLVYVTNCNKQSLKTMRKNYSLMHHGLCNSMVPIVLVVTGCENVRPSVDNWWTKNEPSLTQTGISFAGHACVCAIKGRNIEYQEVVRQLVVQHCLEDGWKQRPIGPPQPYVVDRLGWKTVPAVYESFYDRLRTTFSRQEAKHIIQEISVAGERTLESVT